MYQFKNISVYKIAFFLHFAKFCVFIFWNVCFCRLIAFWPVRDFRPDFWAVSNLEAIWWPFFVGLVFVLPNLLFVFVWLLLFFLCCCFVVVVVACFVVVCFVVACFVVVCCVLLLCVVAVLLLLFCSSFLSFRFFLFFYSVSFASTSTKQMKKVKERKGKNEESNKKTRRRRRRRRRWRRWSREAEQRNPPKGRTQTNHKTRKLEQSSSMVGLNQTNKICIYSFFVSSSFFLHFVFLSLFLFYFLYPLFCFKVKEKEAGLFVVLSFCFCCLGNEQRKND